LSGHTRYFRPAQVEAVGSRVVRPFLPSRALGARFLPIDVTDDASVVAAAENVAEHEGRVDVLINNAGITGPHRDAIDLTNADALGVFDVNLFGVIRTTAAFVPLLRRSPDPATARPISMTTTARRPSPRARTRSCSSRPRGPARDPGASSIVRARSACRSR
jgi:NAD(P)-dependent dehydrogenase (short-subunit alcohol dehydrogenase family)